MSFAVLTLEKAKHLETSGKTSHTLAQTWQTLLESAFLLGGIKLFAVDPDKILFVTSNAQEQELVRNFLLTETPAEWLDYIEVNQQRYFPNGRSQEIDPDHLRKRKAAEWGWERKLSPDPNAKRVVKGLSEREQGEQRESTEKARRGSESQI